MLVVPAAHVANIYEIEHDLGGALVVTVSLVARALKQVWGADGVTVRQNNDLAGGQDVFHLHFHVVPRFEDDLYGRVRNFSEVPIEERVEQARKLAGALDFS